MIYHHEGKEYKITESAKCAERLEPFLRGCGFDMGYGGKKVVEEAIGVDNRKDAEHPCNLDLQSYPDEYADQLGTFDYVFSSHCLEHLQSSRVDQVLRDWYALLRPGGFLVLYLPDRITYGEHGPWTLVSLIELVNRLFPNEEISHAGRFPFLPEYSIEVVVRKNDGRPRKL
jgi:SAM-dependent methyltransferase